MAIRVRPKLPKDQITGQIKTEANKVLVSDKGIPKKYTFDYVAPEETSQAEIFNNYAKQIKDYTLENYNCTILVYGDTGTGKKTHTHFGTNFLLNGWFNIKEDESLGILPRVIDYLFKQCQSSNSRISFTCSFLEIYQEEFKELLDPA